MPTLADIATLLRVPPPAEGADQHVTGLATLDEAGPTELSFLGTDAYARQFATTRALAVIVNRRVKLPSEAAAPAGAPAAAGAGAPAAGAPAAASAPARPIVFTVDDADLAVARVLERFAPPIPRPPNGIDPRASVDPSAVFGTAVAVAANVVVGPRTRIGKNTVLHPGVVLGADVVVGDDCELFPNVVVRERVTMGHRVIIHAGSVIGSDGFGYRWDGAQHQKIPQIGTVIIEDDVEIGSCVCVDRAKFSTTRIGRGTKIDNLVQVGHNVQIGPHCIVVGQVGLAGSVRLGAGVVLGGQCAVRDHITVGDGAMVAGCAGVAEDVDPKTVVSGLPALPHRQSLREQAALRRLPDLVVQVRKLQEELDALKQRAGQQQT